MSETNAWALAATTASITLGSVPDGVGQASAEPFHDALQIIAEGLTELVGFGMAVINVRRGEDFVVVAVAGVDGARRPDGSRESMEAMVGNRWPVSRLEQLLAVADDWGSFKFIPGDRVPRGTWTWEPTPATADGPDAWHRGDGAVAPILDGDGRLVGSISVDAPLTGRRPDAAQLRVMDRYVAGTANILLAALDSEELARRLRLAEGARQLVRTASRQVRLDELLDETGPAFLEAFAAAGMWLRIRGSEDSLPAGSRHELPDLPTPEVAASVLATADVLWERRQAAVAYTDGRMVNTSLPPAQCALILDVLRDLGLGSVLHAPIGDGEECLGSLVLARAAGQPDWSAIELDQATEVGRDIGRVVHNARALARAHELVRKLRELDAHKSRLVAMISHELRNPLTVLLANRETLEPELDDEAARSLLADIDANAQRMGRVVDNLLALARLADPSTPHEERDVDLRPLLQQVETGFTASMGQRGISLRVSLPDRPLTVRGSAEELRILLANVIGNGIKFSHDGGHVEVTATAANGRVEVEVVDHGIGMSPEDRARLFSDFFRSQDLEVLGRPGSGLGLNIVDRVLRRHHGHAEVTSTLGEGTTFRVVLPAADAP